MAFVLFVFSITLTAAPAPTVLAFAKPVPTFKLLVFWLALTFISLPTVIFALPTFASTVLSLI